MKHISLLLASLTVAACGIESTQTISPSPSTAPASPATSASASTEAPVADEPAPATHKAGDPVVFTPAPGWVVETPTSKMRVAQYKLPKAAGDPEDAELVVFNFGATGGGSIEANLARWSSQFAQPDGGDSAALMQRSERKVNGIDVTEVRLSGSYVAETFPGSGERVNKPNFALLAAILDNGDNDYYVKLTGPAATVEQHAAAFREFISNVK